MQLRSSAALVLLAILSSAHTLDAQRRDPKDPTPLTETERIQHVLSRFAFGATVELVKEVRAKGLEPWFEAQMLASNKESYELGERLRPLETTRMSGAELLQKHNPRNPGPTAPAEKRREYRRLRDMPNRELRRSIVWRGVYSSNPVQEVVVDFWRNHFSVDIGKGYLRIWALPYERDVLRAHAFGRFGQMLEASAKHPAMLIYLDNALSRRPATKGELSTVRERARARSRSKGRAAEAVEIAKQRGLNENYARELLELHTLGVDNFYRQKDVVEVAKALTGWTVNKNAKVGDVGFQYRKGMHVRGTKYFLGRPIRADKKNPLIEGELVLRRLEKHPGTARFLAWKLCRHFVDDKPSDALVGRMAEAFRRGKGDLKAVYRALISDPEFFAPRYYQSKFKRPFEFVISAIRVTRAKVEDPRALLDTLALLQEPLYRQEDPTGYYDTAEAWNALASWPCAGSSPSSSRRTRSLASACPTAFTRDCTRAFRACGRTSSPVACFPRGSACGARARSIA